MSFSSTQSDELVESGEIVDDFPSQEGSDSPGSLADFINDDVTEDSEGGAAVDAHLQTPRRRAASEDEVFDRVERQRKAKRKLETLTGTGRSRTRQDRVVSSGFVPRMLFARQPSGLVQDATQGTGVPFSCCHCGAVEARASQVVSDVIKAQGVLDSILDSIEGLKDLVQHSSTWVGTAMSEQDGCGRGSTVSTQVQESGCRPLATQAWELSETDCGDEGGRTPPNPSQRLPQRKRLRRCLYSSEEEEL
ncbi:hypothetical protein BDP55DRAFT_389685 [Colletotrichum godetiae]|uniref:Uncharacterized protein n=1 Tax=Colletotrichum godetiae TaxID=1209918 RepID=A0AAJ0AD29_9PEZI|nr:uncharacterized protein BDP55DRAFT_389656 [Colletotrichum godetiae]XP_060423454.1 uncharacterized protein BDP55DRAFT_389685 [Colletotrichum godetiae]KAK1658689.1 hypothetical protein BDP55DRAFT_389656 [Colletotrichum godetiae]KAK1658690.1 hypothetical protein BDP55DRAFT_389685 [Colletotrichum godetiae]